LLNLVVTPLTYLRTIRHLRAEQIIARLRQSLPRRPTPAMSAPPLRARHGSFGSPILRAGPIRRGCLFSFLNREGAVSSAADWNDARHEKLWLYNLHYFDWLKETATTQRVADDADWIAKWVAENPIARGAGWEPYPLSLRIVNWVIWLNTLGTANSAQLDSLATQARHLGRSVEYHLLGNHLFANAKALVFAGTFFDGPEAGDWRSVGLDLLARELPEQILSDGGHFELSPMYHSVILEDYLDLLGLASAHPDVLKGPFASLKLPDVASRMVEWLQTMIHPDGEISYFNDAAIGIAASPSALFEYAKLRGASVGTAKPSGAMLPASGYATISHPPFHLIFDCGRVGPDYQPGHAHADTLSFELSVGNERVITNSGTSTYAAGAERLWERSTAAHATVQVDDEDSAEVWAAFRVGRRPNVAAIEHGEDGAAEWVECSHDGYRHLPGSPHHRRRVTVSDEQVRIDDWIEGSGEHVATGSLPLAPDTRISQTSKGQWFGQLAQGQGLTFDFEGPVEVVLQQGRFAPQMGITCERSVLEWRATVKLPLHVVTQIRLVRQ
jgi:uncharacterized heparinase superfamily protein